MEFGLEKHHFCSERCYFRFWIRWTPGRTGQELRKKLRELEKELREVNGTMDSPKGETAH